MARSLSYADAARLLGGSESRIVAALERTAGWLMLGTAPVLSEVLSWFDAKAELSRLSHQLVRDLSERRSGLSRHGRTERIEAAHTVIVIAAFFESLAGVRLPVSPTRREQVAMGAGGAAGPARLTAQIMSAGRLLPEPGRSLADFRDDLQRYYQELAETVDRFLDGLDVVRDSSRLGRAQITEMLDEVPHRAVTRYDDALLQLTADFPEVGYWAHRIDQRATHASLAGLAAVLESIHTGRAPDVRRRGLAAFYRDDLLRPVVDSGDVPDGVTVPSLGAAYLPPRFRVSDGAGNSLVSDEDWWMRHAVRDDLRDFLIGHLTSPQAVRSPLLLLGQPGSGKSVFTRVLAASLPESEFLTVRVVLRDTPSLDQVQDQAEHAIRAATGERTEWAELIRSAGDALPLLLLDGFDELLQATGVSQTDYLERVAAFQRREASQGRPIAVIVTSRTAVAGQARLPEETVALRLEPFDEQQIGAWLAVWERTNSAAFAARGIQPLTTASVLPHQHLAGQPLLLLMLALYDVDGNALQRSGADLRQDQLYERLLRSFTVREVTKSRPGQSSRQLEAAVEEELRRLAVVAFAMFNRSVLWVGTADLERDLNALLGPSRTASDGLRPALRSAELTLGRFFFIHRARASSGPTGVETYEFLHATFTEFFVARLTWQVLCDVVAQASASTAPFGRPPVHDDLLRALLSHQPLSRRSTIIDFLAGMAGSAAPDLRAELRDLLIQLFRSLITSPAPQHYTGYQPTGRGEPARQATYSANLLILIVAVSDEVHAGELFPGRPFPLHRWVAQALLWNSQLTAGSWTSLVDSLAVDRIRSGTDRDLRIRRDDGSWEPPPIDPSWTFATDLPGGGPGSWLTGENNLSHTQRRRSANLVGDAVADMNQYVVDAFAGSPDWETSRFFVTADDGLRSPPREILDLWVNPTLAVYHRCVELVTSGSPGWAQQTRLRVARRILDRLITDARITPADATEVLGRLLDPLPPFWIGQLTTRIVTCALTYLGRGGEPDQRLARIMHAILMPDLGAADAVPAADVLVRLHELGLPVPPVTEIRSRERFDALLGKVAAQRPDLVQRLSPLDPRLAALEDLAGRRKPGGDGTVR